MKGGKRWEKIPPNEFLVTELVEVGSVVATRTVTRSRLCANVAMRSSSDIGCDEMRVLSNGGSTGLIEQGLTSHQTHYRSYRGRFLQVI